MTSHVSSEKSPKPVAKGGTRRKVFALAAGAAVLGIGATATLAAWTDSEWVFGGDGTGGPGIGTSTFNVQQSVDEPFTVFNDEPANPGGEMVFEPGALDLAPGDSVYALMALRTAPDSIAGDVTLEAAVGAQGVVPPATDPGILAAALDLRVATLDDTFTCDATAFSGLLGAPTIIADGPLVGTGGSVPQTLDALAASTQYYCFEITLPDGFTPTPPNTVDDYMGLTVAPAWEFTAESN